MKNLIILLFFIFILSLANADSIEKNLLVNEKTHQGKSIQEIKSYPALYQFRNGVIENRDSSTGIFDEPFYLMNDSSVINLSYSAALDQKQPTKIQAFDFNYFYKPKLPQSELWYGFQLRRVSALFSAMADDKTYKTEDIDENTQIMNIFGLGISYRFKIVSDFLTKNRFYENIDVFFNYLQSQDADTAEQFTGQGYNASYSLNYRSGKYFHYGFKIGYNQSWLYQAAENDEKLQARSLVFGFMDVGITAGLYF